MKLLLLLPVLLPVLLCAAEGVALSGVQELHGSFHGEPFWLRLRLPNASYQDNRVLQLLYKPPPPEALGGTILRGHPDVLVNDNLHVIAWKERGDSGTAVLWRGGSAQHYQCAFELLDDDRFQVDTAQRDLAAPVWDLDLAPLLALLVAPDALPLRTWGIRLMQRQAVEPLPIELTREQLRLGEHAYAISRDASGAIVSISDSNGIAIVVVGTLPAQPLGGEDVQLLE